MDAVLCDGVLLNGLDTCLYFCMKQFRLQINNCPHYLSLNHLILQDLFS